jgi:hypothetical protein
MIPPRGSCETWWYPLHIKCAVDAPALPYQAWILYHFLVLLSRVEV